MADPSWLEILLLLGLSAMAGFINVMAAGGSSLILPSLILLGFDGAMANGTLRMAIFMQNVFAVQSFRQEDFKEFKQSLIYSAFAMPGATLGALVAVRIPVDLVQMILGGVLLLIVITIFVKPPKKPLFAERPNIGNALTYFTLFFVGLYGGFIQVGVGVLLMLPLLMLQDLSLVRVNLHKVTIVLIYTIPALLIFGLSGHINYKYGLVLAAGQAFGGWWSAKLQIRSGANLVKIALAIAAIILSLKLFKVI
jgi:hypothetical protein